ncbi:hypothetical protein QYF36_000784 [Acer negundo]|nr:hypothetical protein QYF36_000784 [Acer negundo]
MMGFGTDVGASDLFNGLMVIENSHHVRDNSSVPLDTKVEASQSLELEMEGEAILCSLDVDKRRKSRKKDVEGNQSSWYLEAEIAKVIEIRFTIEWLRTRFSRNEEEMSQAQIDTETTIVDTLGNQEIVVEVSRRELEDIALFAGPDKSQ